MLSNVIFYLLLFIIKSFGCCLLWWVSEKGETVKKRIKNLLIKASAACAFIGMLAAPGTIVSPGFTWDELPAVIGITAACAGDVYKRQGLGSASADIFLTESLRSPFHSGRR